ncbi:MAG: hypothetical protein E7665_05660 [Ruminococcaceae bacterium]|nr:hypothetical protein [Oscillospiraceae bacterium]
MQKQKISIILFLFLLILLLTACTSANATEICVTVNRSESFGGYTVNVEKIFGSENEAYALISLTIPNGLKIKDVKIGNINVDTNADKDSTSYNYKCLRIDEQTNKQYYALSIRSEKKLLGKKVTVKVNDIEISRINPDNLFNKTVLDAEFIIPFKIDYIPCNVTVNFEEDPSDTPVISVLTDSIILTGKEEVF